MAGFGQISRARCGWGNYRLLSLAIGPADGINGVHGPNATRYVRARACSLFPWALIKLQRVHVCVSSLLLISRFQNWRVSPSVATFIFPHAGSDPNILHKIIFGALSVCHELSTWKVGGLSVQHARASKLSCDWAYTSDKTENYSDERELQMTDVHQY